MRLTRLEIYGFKSFAKRTEIVFPQNVTGIVGPNGSGKSNIGDAVRWVLGEQSAKMLRGNSMADVIFNGTEKRKPLNYCEVTLVFDNTDHQLQAPFDEVSITRRVYRSGDSEYLMNGSNCRLKDIVDLFRDTGRGQGRLFHHRSGPHRRYPQPAQRGPARHLRGGGGHQPLPLAQGGGRGTPQARGRESGARGGRAGRAGKPPHPAQKAGRYGA